MVDAYVTALGSLTLAVDDERFLLESSVSNSLLSLHPAFTPAERSHPIAYDGVAGFSTQEDQIKVDWQAVEDVSACSTVELAGEGRLLLQVSLTNTSDRPYGIKGLHPLWFSADGPGACALGAGQARTLASRRPAGAMRLRELAGEPLHSEHVAAWFPPQGSPMILLGATENCEQPTVFEFHAARGKILSLRIDAPVDAPYSLEPGETLGAPALMVSVGDRDVRDELRAWGERFQGADLEFLNDFDPGAEIEEEPEETGEPAEEPASAEEELSEEEPEAKIEEDSEEAEAPEEPKESAEEAASAECEPSEEESDAEPEYESAASCEGAAIDWEEEAEPEPESETERAFPEPDEEENAPWPVAAPTSGGGVRSRPVGGVAEFRRARRRAEGVYPRWAAGRRYASQSGLEARARRLWRR